ncbi:MAG: iron-sulfur cluster assembly protein [Draconibacterium sp.]|nr:iron-sulfur cluster assembly protein [Draconibacterium sp.]
MDLQNIILELEKVKHPTINCSLVKLGIVNDIRLIDNKILVTFAFPYANTSIANDVKVAIEHKNESLFYNEATFFSTDEIISLLENARFRIEEINQTVFGLLHELTETQMPKKGFGEGSFVVIKAKK